MIRCIGFILLVLTSVVSADRFAMIIAPRTPYADYGVPSESCRLYNDLIKGGMKEENIILMSSTAIANHPNNPFPGQLFTDDSPDAPGIDYAQNCLDHIDYDETHFRGAFLLNLMMGNAAEISKITGIENPKVLKSGPEDEMLFYFTSHGMDEEIVVGDTRIFKDDFIWALHCMHDNGKFKHMLLFMETCYSGSMFRDLSPEENIYVITAADHKHESYESHCPPDDVVDGKPIGACLSCLWDNAMEWFIEGSSLYTLDEVFQYTHDKVAEESKQNVSRYGNLELGEMKIENFVGKLPANQLGGKSISTSVPKSEVSAYLAKWKVIRADREHLSSALKEYQKISFQKAKEEIEVMRLSCFLVDEKVTAKAMMVPAESYSASCVQEFAHQFVSNCGHSYPLSMKTINVLRNLCIPGRSYPSVDFSTICL